MHEQEATSGCGAARGFSRSLAAHITNTAPSDVPASAREAARRSLLDAVGVSVAASGLVPETIPFLHVARQQAGVPDATVLGHWEGVSVLGAVLANGALAHALDFEDTHDSALCHSSAQVVPVLLALAEGRQGISGLAFLAAMAVGADLTCRLSEVLSDPLRVRGWYPPSLLGAFGATAAGAHLLGLSERQTVSAFSLLIGQLGSHGQIIHESGSPMRAVRDGFPAHAACLSVLLAENGLQGYQEPFLGAGGLVQAYAGGAVDIQAAIQGLGERWAGTEVSYKPWPSCRATHPFVEAALDLRRHVASDDVVSVRLAGSPRVTAIVAAPRASITRPEHVIEAKFSAPFTAALAIVDGRLDLDSFSAARLTDPAVVDLAGRTVYVEDSKYGVDAGLVELLLTGGRTVSREILAAYGSPLNPISDDDLLRKFHSCVRHSAVARPTKPWEIFTTRVSQLESADNAGLLLAEVTATSRIPAEAGTDSSGRIG